MNALVDRSYREGDLADIPVSEIAAFVAACERVPEPCEVSISFVDDEAMARLNAEYRGMEGPTDVLSFECDNADDGLGFAQAAGEVYELGDIVVAPDVAERQAARFGNGFRGEIELLLVHGMLHLCGYDHVEDADAAQMEARERELLHEWCARTGEREICR